MSRSPLIANDREHCDSNGAQKALAGIPIFFSLEVSAHCPNPRRRFVCSWTWPHVTPCHQQSSESMFAWTTYMGRKFNPVTSSNRGCWSCTQLRMQYIGSSSAFRATSITQPTDFAPFRFFRNDMENTVGAHFGRENISTVRTGERRQEIATLSTGAHKSARVRDQADP